MDIDMKMIALIGIGGFDASMAQQTSSGTLTLLATFAGIPAALLLIVAPLLWSFPIDARRHRVIIERLRRRDARRLRTVPSSMSVS